MRGRIQIALLAVLATGLVLGLSACMGNWLGTPTKATLIIGDPVLSTGKGQVILSVADMPQDGLASLAVKVDGVTYVTTKVSHVVVTGINGFTVLASQFDDATGKGEFLIVNPTSGTVTGPVAKLEFDVTGTVTGAPFGFDKPKIELGSSLNTLMLITTWDLGTGKAYYAN
jgi:hypothetical protein